MFVHGHSLDVPVTVPSTDTRTWGGDIGCSSTDTPWTWGGGIGCSSTDIPWTSQLVCHPLTLGYQDMGKVHVDSLWMSQ